MAINIRDLARMCEFNFELTSLGTVRCLCLNTEYLSQANKKLTASGVSSLDFVRWLFGEMARRPIDVSSDDADKTEAPRLTTEELSSVTDGDLEEFAEKLIQKNRYLLKTHKGRDIERSVDESTCDFLVRAFRHYAAEQKANRERLMQSVSSSLYSNTTLKAMQRNLGLSDQLRDTIEKYSRTTPIAGLEVNAHRMPEFHIPKNPIHDTNEILGRVVRQVEDLRPLAAQSAEIIRSMNDTALRMQADYIENSQKTEHQTQITIQQTKVAVKIAAVSLIVSAIGLIISAFFSYQSYVDAKKSNESSDAQAKAFQSEIRDLVAAQREERASIVKNIVNARSVPAAAVKK